MRFAFLRSFNLENFKATFLRFPLSILSGAVASGCDVWMSYTMYDGVNQDVAKLMLSSFVGILLFTGLALLAEGHRLRSWLIQLLGIPVLYLLIYRLDLSHDMADAVRVGLLLLSSLALIFVGPYLAARDDKSFWLFFVKVWNRAMFAIATAVITAVALALALVSIEHLFEVMVDGRYYQYVYSIFLVFVPNLVFLMGIPGDTKALEKETHSISFRALGTYLFAPLLSVYFVILATYVVKILVTQVWPNGFVAMPIVIFSAIGFGMYSLIFPLLQEKDNRFLKFFNRIFLWSLPVFTVVYFIAFWQRIEQYGMTEMRYLGVALGVLILAWSLYFGWVKKPHLKLIPFGLFVVPFLVSFGPWGVFQVAERSQLGRLETVLTEHGLLKDGAIVPATDEAVDLKTLRDISGSLDYLVSNYGEESVATWFGGEEAVKGIGSSGLMKKMGLSYEAVYDFAPLDGGTDYYFTVNDTDPENITGYEYQMHYYFYDMTPPAEDLSYTVGEKQLTFHYNSISDAVELSGVGETLSIPLKDFIDGLENDHPEEGPLSRDALSVSGQNSAVSVKIYFTNLSYHNLDGERSGFSADAQVLVKLK